METRAFGWLPLRIDVAGDSWKLRTLDHFDEAVENVLKSDRIGKDWYWPDLVDGPPLRPAKAYHLPTTHEITVEGGSHAEEERLAEFLIAFTGFLYGIVLTPEGWTQFNRVSINPRRWQDFGLTDTARTRILNAAARTWGSHTSIRKDLFGAVWWHTFAIAYEQPFERFMAQYLVLDSCWAIHEKRTGCKRPPHAARVAQLASAYGLQVPGNWSSAAPADRLVEIRNALFHEAKWGGQPIGFGHPAKPNEGVHLELYWFNSRLILALSGDDNAYVHSKIVYQPHLIK